MKKIFSIFLALCIIVNMLPVTAMSEEMDTTIGTMEEIISFAPLTETEKTVSLGTSSEELELPETLTATVRTAVSIGEDSVQDSGSPETATPTTVTEPEWEETTMDIPVKWESTPEYYMDAEGEYIFRPVIEDYTVSSDLPEIRVMVETAMLRGMMFSPMSANVAKIGTTEYATLQLAANAVSNGQTIELLDNITGRMFTLPLNSKSFTLDLNSKTLTSNDSNYQNSTIYHGGSGTLTIIDSGTGGMVKEQSINPAIHLMGAGKLVVSGGTVNSVQSCAISGGSGSSITISEDAKITSQNVDGTIFLLNDSLTLEGGTIENTGSGVAITDWGGDGKSSFKVEIPVGKSAIVRSGGKATTLAPTLTNSIAKASKEYNGAVLGTYNAANIADYKYLKFEPDPVSTHVAQIGSTSYITLQDAIDVVTEGQTIQLLDNIKLTATVTVASDSTKSFILDLNGKTLNGDNAIAIQHNGGTLTVQDTKGEGKVTSKVADGTIHLKGGSLVVVSGIVENTNASASNAAVSNVENGSVSVEGGTVTALGTRSFGIANHSTGLVSVLSGTVSSGFRAIVNVMSGKVSISGGIVKCTGSSTSAEAIANISTGEVSVSGGEVDGGNGTGIYNFPDGKIVIPSGSPIIKGNYHAMDKAPDLSSYVNVNVKVTASENVSGTPVVTYEEVNIKKYKYLKFEPATVPDTPTNVTATAGDGQASVSFTAPASNGGVEIAGYTVTSDPGGFTGTGTASPIIVARLTNGISYTFTVTATNSVGTSTASAASNSVTAMASQTITFNNPGTQSFGTTPTITATASSGLPVTFTSNTPGVCTITSAGKLTFISAGTATITADQAGNGSYLMAPSVTQTFTVNPVQPGAPTNLVATPGDKQLTLTWAAPASSGGSSIIDYQVSVDNGETYTATGSSSTSYTVTGLTNGTIYSLKVRAVNAIGAGAASSGVVAKPAAATYTISGTITGSDTSSGISGAAVQLKNGSGNVGSAVFTNQSGEYTIPNASAGTYSIEASAPGYNSGTTSSVVVSNANVTGKDLTLTRIVSFTPVTGITMTTADSVQVGSDLTLTGTVYPFNATNRTITWSVVNANGTGATIDGDIFRATSTGTATVKATVANGTTASSDYTKTFDITVTAAPVAPNSLTGTATINNTAPRIGNRLTGSLVGGNNTGYLSYVWRTGSTQLGTGSEYIVAVADLGKTITLEITSNVETGTVTSTTTAVAKKAAPTAPSAPTLVSKTHNTVTLAANTAYEFSKDGTNWQTSPIFTGLTENTAYTFYQKVGETADTEASVASTGFSVTTNSNSSGGSGGNSGGSSSGSDSSDTSSNSSPVIVIPPAKPNDPTQGEIKVPGTADGKGNITVNITNKTVTDAFDKALADAKKNGNDQNGITVVLRVDTSSKNSSNVTVNLPKTVQDTIIAKKIVKTIVVVDNPDIRIGMDLETVQEINKQAKSDVNITTNRRDSYKLTGDAKKVIGSRPVFEFKVNYGGGKQVQSFGTGNVSVTIPYTLGTNEKAENVQAVYVDGNEKLHWLVNSVYDSVEKVLRFSTNHFSTYGVGYKEDAPSFTDIASHWAKEDIEFVVSSGLFSGTSATTFSPNTAMTRGMFVTALGRLANADVSSYNKSNFTDVKSDAYYMSYVEWASKNSIVNGTGNGKFAPDQSITREEMAVIMHNYSKVMSFTMPKAHGENTFADSSKISTYAKDAAKAMQMAGVISGKNGNLFDPQGTATRAEVAAVLRRFVELEI